MPQDLPAAPLRRRRLCAWCLTAAMVWSAGLPSEAVAKPVAKISGPAEDLAKEATRRYKEGEFELAAQLFMKAYALDKRPDRVFNAARGFEKAGKAEQAIALFRLYIQITDDEAGRQEAQLRVDALEAALRAGPATPPPAISPPTTPPPASSASPEPTDPAGAPTMTAQSPQRPHRMPPVITAPAHSPASPWPAWTAFGIAAVAAASAGGMYYWVRKDETDLHELLEIRTDAGYVSGIDQEHAVERHLVQGTVRTWAAIGGSIALASVAVGLWLWPRPAAAPQDLGPSVQVGPDGVALSVRF